MLRLLTEFDMNRKFYLNSGGKANPPGPKTRARCGIVRNSDERAYLQFLGRAGDDAARSAGAGRRRA